MKLTTFSRINKLKSLHIDVEKSYIKYVSKYIDSKDFIYKNQNIPEKEYIQKNFFSILMLLILDTNKITNLKSHGLIIHSIRNIVTATDNVIDNENKGNLDIIKLKNPILKNVMSLLIAEDIMNTELQLLKERESKTFKVEDIKLHLLKSIYEIAKGEEVRAVVNDNYMTYDEVINRIHTKIGGELLAISMLVPFLISNNSNLLNFKEALFKIGMSLQLLDDIIDLDEDIHSNTQNAFMSYLLDNSIAINEITDYNNGSNNEIIKDYYYKLIYSAINTGLSGFQEFEKNGLEIGYKDGEKLMEFMFINRGMQSEWKIYKKMARGESGNNGYSKNLF